MIQEFIQGKIDIYREITSDLFTCSIMGLDSFGYLVVVAENFVFKERNKAAMYQRVSMVLQCLSKKRRKDRLGSEQFDRELMDLLRREVQKLVLAPGEVKVGDIEKDLTNTNIDEIIKILKNLREIKGLTSTQHWILGVYLQIAGIIYNIMGTSLACGEIGEKDIWRDMISENPYIHKKDRLSAFLEKNCKRIMQ